MVALREAMKLCGVRNNDLIYLAPVGGARSDGMWEHVGTIREKYDMRKPIVYNIYPRFSNEDYMGMEFRILPSAYVRVSNNAMRRQKRKNRGYQRMRKQRDRTPYEAQTSLTKL